MTIIRDAYLFNPSAYVTATKKYVHLLAGDRLEAWNSIHLAAQKCFDENSLVERLASEYGGWDRHSLIAEFPSTDPPGAEDYAFMLTMLLFAQLSEPTPARRFGLGRSWSEISTLLRSIGWQEDDARLSIGGRKSARLLTDTQLSSAILPGTVDWILEIWKNVGPVSTCGTIGWLDESDIHRLRPLVDRERHGDKTVQCLLELLASMLFTAEQANSGLCLIISG